MRYLASRRLIQGLSALAVLAAYVLVPLPAQASKALFRVHRYFISTETISNYLEPTPMKAPAAAYVFNVAQRFVLPGSFISYMVQHYCGQPMQGMCFPGYPISGGYYSYVNGQGRFGAGGPSRGAPGPSVTTTAVFPTTMGNNLPFAPVKNHTAMSMYTIMDAAANAGQGNPVTPTTKFSGRYDFSRGGSIQITPGANKFSGTMRFIYGPNASFYQFIDYFTPNLYKAYGSFTGPPSTDETNVGETTSSGAVTRFLLTPIGANKATDGMGGYVSSQAHYLHLLAPWTTGMIEIYNVIGYYQTRLTKTGFDNKTPGMVGSLNPTRVVSLVRPRLVHAYLNPSNPSDPIITNFQAARVWRMDVLFLPEPGEIALLVTGIVGLVGLAGLARLRRR